MNRALRRWVPVAMYAGLILAVSSIPGESMPIKVWSWDKLIHACEYFVLGALAARALRWRLTPWVAFAVAAALAGAFGALDEWYQTTTPGRDGSPYDAIADLVGGTLGALSVTLWWRRRNSNGDRA